MRTTIRLDDQLYARLKERAARTGRTLGSVIEDALREALARMDDAARNSEPVTLTTVGGRGPRPGVDLDDSASLHELMDDGGS